MSRDIGELSPKELEQIEQSKVASQKKYQLIRAEHQAKRQKHKEQKAMAVEGLKWLKEQEEETLVIPVTVIQKWNFKPQVLGILHKPQYSKCMFEYAYAIKSPSDHWNETLAWGLPAYRIKTKAQYWYNWLSLPEDFSKYAYNTGDDEDAESILRRLLHFEVAKRIYLQMPEVPRSLIRKEFNSLKRY